ncbi:PREDICTED: mitochondrial substrate carrier family protein C isoform X2 [Ipomoea nil]|uniref:mitochondrial substrate carrier family protein C isoform X2 n=1 Tax=Ipomoea nil TaxID=35883 RepID=UPI000901ACE3|nr:PREDICTED: mitochondrial substrate carrier family protein C isoform X2 [Ipomoea nil]
MAWGNQPPKGDKLPTKYRCNLLEGAFFELADSDRENYATISSENKKQNNKIAERERKPPEIMTTRELISAVGNIWNSAAHPLSFILSSASSAHRNVDPQENDILYFPPMEDSCSSPPSADGKNTPVHLSCDKDSSLLVSKNPESLNANRNISFFESRNKRDYLWRFLRNGLDVQHKSSKGIGLSSLRISYNLENVYGWMNEIAFSKSKLGSSSIQNHEFGDCSLGNINSSGNTDCHTDIKPTSSLSSHNLNLHKSSGASNSALCSKNGNVLFHVLEPNAFQMSSSEVHGYSSEKHSTSEYCACDETKYENRSDSGLDDYGPNQRFGGIECNSESEISVVAKEKPCHALAKQEHAFAGAMAGIFVSLCLHPMDTIKTVIQSCRADQKPFYYIGRSVISERGVLGLYRGISSNIASSAPISALYTFTYESVKGALLPFLHTEYQSVAHCVAGGCASVATSFIFTPSERVKQQMQVRSHYKNCWNALIGIIRRGGLPSLYAGWGAVLCRNVPHSIIKFYTYESLKQLMSSSVQFDIQNNTLMTLVCGGLAGSTAALFTTPFDVVKTRLQTQVPGSNQYDGVLHTLKEIGKSEGLKGLYRGLTPRLVMYMTQGALFFASYESFKRLFSLDLHQSSAQRTHHEPCFGDDSTLSSVKE